VQLDKAAGEIGRMTTMKDGSMGSSQAPPWLAAVTFFPFVELSQSMARHT